MTGNHEHVYEASPAKRQQHTQAALCECEQEHRPITVRQLFSAASVREDALKTEAGHGWVARELVKVQKTVVLPFPWIADSTCWPRKLHTLERLEAALEITARTYRRSWWRRTAKSVEIWLEKTEERESLSAMAAQLRGGTA